MKTALCEISYILSVLVALLCIPLAWLFFAFPRKWAAHSKRK